MSKIKILTFLIFLSQLTFAQNNRLDSLRTVVKTTNIDTARINALNSITLLQIQKNQLKTIDSIELAIKESSNIKYNKGLANAYKNKAIYFYKTSTLDSAFFYFRLSIKHYEKDNDKENIARIYNNIGLIYKSRNQLDSAIIYYSKSIDYFNQTEDKRPIMVIWNNLATVYTQMSDYQRALEAGIEGLKIFDKIPNKTLDDSLRLAYLYNTIANIYTIQKQYKKSEDNYYEALKIFTKLKSNSDIGDIYTNLGIIEIKKSELDTATNIKNYYQKSLYHHLKAKELYSSKNKIALANYNIADTYIYLSNYDSANYYLTEAEKIYIELKDEKGIALCNFLNGVILYKSMDYTKSIEKLEKALQFAQKINDINFISQISDYLYRCYKLTGNYIKALEMHELFKKSNDSIFNTNNERKLTEIALSYNFEKEKRETELKHKEELKRQKLIKTFLLIGVFIAILIAFIVVWFLISTRRKNAQLRKLNAEIIMQKEEIEAQKNYIEEQAIEIQKQRDLAIQRGNEIEKKNQDIEASIYYALRIQQALLPSTDILKKFFSEFSIYYKPRDIVSGDFYWFAQKDEKIYVAAADCTGHGVPGAFMSLLGISFFNQIFTEFPNISSSQFLNKVRDLIIKSLKQDTDDIESSRDGMDMSLIIFDKNNLQIQYSGAYNSIYIVSQKEIQTTHHNIVTVKSDNYTLYELKADRMPIGIYLREFKSFSEYNIYINKGDRIYMFSDGFEDMFNKEQTQKFTAGRFKQLILQNQNLSLSQFIDAYENVFIEWNNGQKQIDDILIINLQI